MYGRFSVPYTLRPLGSVGADSKPPCANHSGEYNAGAVVGCSIAKGSSAVSNALSKETTSSATDCGAGAAMVIVWIGATLTLCLLVLGVSCSTGLPWIGATTEATGSVLKRGFIFFLTAMLTSSSSLFYQLRVYRS